MSTMQTGMVLSVMVFSQVSLRLLEHVQNADWNGFVSYGFFSGFFEAVRTCPESRLEWFCPLWFFSQVSLRLLEHVQNADLIVLSVKFFSQVLRLLEHVQNADWSGFVSQGFVVLSCFFEAVRTCPECRLEWFSQSVFFSFFFFSPLDVRTHPVYRLECFCQSKFCCLSCFFEAVRTCPECRLEQVCQSRCCCFSCFFEAVRTCRECRLEWFCQSDVFLRVSLWLLKDILNAVETGMN